MKAFDHRHVTPKELSSNTSRGETEQEEQFYKTSWTYNVLFLFTERAIASEYSDII